jgi:hypothetical protein
MPQETLDAEAAVAQLVQTEQAVMAVLATQPRLEVVEVVEQTVDQTLLFPQAQTWLVLEETTD